MSVKASCNEDQLGLESPYYRVQYIAIDINNIIIFQFFWNRQIHIVSGPFAFTRLFPITRVRVPSHIMRREIQDSLVRVKQILNRIAMMHIPIDYEYSFKTMLLDC